MKTLSGLAKRGLEFPLIASLAIFLTFSILEARAKIPWSDEGWFANPAYNLAFRGYMGSNVIEPAGHYLNAYLAGIQEKTYYVVPNHIVGLAAWFRMIGFDLLRARLYSILWGCVSLVALHQILKNLFPDRRVAHLAVVFTALDFMFQWSSADVRMESACMALALCALAFYLHFRKEQLTLAIAASQICLAAAVFTHPNALLVGLTLPVLVLRNDLTRLRWKHLLFAATPYFVFAGLWSIYVLQDPQTLRIQFLANAAGRGGSRLKLILHPVYAVYREAVRQMGSYCVPSTWMVRTMPGLFLVLLTYWSGVAWLITHWRRHEAGAKTLAICVVTALSAITWLEGQKMFSYIHYLVPLYNSVLAAWVIWLWRKGGASAGMGLALACLFLSLELPATLLHIADDQYHQDFVPVASIVESQRQQGRQIVGLATLGFELGFRGFHDDWRLGIYSHLHPDVILVDRSYRAFIAISETEEPSVFDHVVRMLTTDYRLARRYGEYWIFEKEPGSAMDRKPWLEVPGLNNCSDKSACLWAAIRNAPETRRLNGSAI